MDFGFTKPYSEKTAELIDNEVKEIIGESYIRAQEVLKKNIKGLTELAELLLEKEVIFGEDLERIFGKRKVDVDREAEEALSRSPVVEVLPDNNPEKSLEIKNKKKEGKKKSGSPSKETDDLKKPAKKAKAKEKK
jgi:hypothetical protein